MGRSRGRKFEYRRWRESGKKMVREQVRGRCLRRVCRANIVSVSTPRLMIFRLFHPDKFDPLRTTTLETHSSELFLHRGAILVICVLIVARITASLAILRQMELQHTRRLASKSFIILCKKKVSRNSQDRKKFTRGFKIPHR